MRITNNVTNTRTPNFGMSVVATKESIKYMNNRLAPEDIKTVNKMFASQYGKKPDINLLTGVFKNVNNRKEVQFLKATVNDKSFEEGLFTSAFGVIKKAVNYAEKIQKKA